MRNKLVLGAAAAIFLLGAGLLGVVHFRASSESLQGFALGVLHEGHPDWRLEKIGKTGISIQADGRVVHLYLDNIAREAGSDRARARALIKSAVLTLSGQPAMADGGAALPKLDDVRAELRPTLVPRGYAEQYGLAQHSFVGDVVEALVIDDARSTRYVLTVDLVTWHAELAPLLKTAESALWQSSASLPLKLQSPEDPSKSGQFVTLSTRDGYDAARLVLPEMRSALGKELGYPFFAAIPNRDFLVAWSSGYSFAEQFASKVREDFGARSHPVSPNVFRIEADKIELVP